MSRYGKAPSDKNKEPEEPREDVVFVEQQVTEIRGRGFSSPFQEEELRSKGLVVCFIKYSDTRPLPVIVNGVTYELPDQQWIRVPVGVRDVLANAGLL